MDRLRVGQTNHKLILRQDLNSISENLKTHFSLLTYELPLVWSRCTSRAQKPIVDAVLRQQVIKRRRERD